jgi:hypothetical protein
VIFAFEKITNAFIQRDTQFISDANERIGCTPNQPCAPQIEAYAKCDFFGVGASADAM